MRCGWVKIFYESRRSFRNFAGKTKKILAALEGEGKKILKAAEAYATQVLSKKRMKALAKVRTVLPKGHAAHAVVKKAEKRTSHLMVLGSRGFHDIQGYFMGSGSEWVAAYSGCSILVVRPSVK